MRAVTGPLLLLLAGCIALNVSATHILRRSVDHRQRLDYSRVGRAASLHTPNNHLHQAKQP